MFSKPRKLEEESKRVFITYKDTTRLWFFIVFSSWILNEFSVIFKVSNEGEGCHKSSLTLWAGGSLDANFEAFNSPS